MAAAIGLTCDVMGRIDAETGFVTDDFNADDKYVLFIPYRIDQVGADVVLREKGSGLTAPYARVGVRRDATGAE